MRHACFLAASLVSGEAMEIAALKKLVLPPCPMALFVKNDISQRLVAIHVEGIPSRGARVATLCARVRQDAHLYDLGIQVSLQLSLVQDGLLDGACADQDEDQDIPLLPNAMCSVLGLHVIAKMRHHHCQIVE